MKRNPIIITEDRCDVRDNAIKNTLIILGILTPKQSTESHRGARSNYIWNPFIDEDGNGCVTNVLTGETFIDWTKEELEEQK